MTGGSGTAGLLNDVWRWSPVRCTLLPDLTAELALLYELECAGTCQPSVPYGQWTHLADAPWAPRLGHAMIWTDVGLLLVGGRTADSFKNDIWRWISEGSFCLGKGSGCN